MKVIHIIILVLAGILFFSALMHEPKQGKKFLLSKVSLR